jgi:hypothetical protein
MRMISFFEEDLQCMLNVVSVWCRTYTMQVNAAKTKVVHFRTPSVNQSSYNFMCSDEQIMCVDRYCYLGLVLTEHVHYSVTAKAVSQSASRALGLIISKFKLMGGLPFDVFTTLYDLCVFPVISYGAAI